MWSQATFKKKKTWADFALCSAMCSYIVKTKCCRLITGNPEAQGVIVVWEIRNGFGIFPVQC